MTRDTSALAVCIVVLGLLCAFLCADDYSQRRLNVELSNCRLEMANARGRLEALDNWLGVAAQVRGGTGPYVGHR